MQRANQIKVILFVFFCGFNLSLYAVGKKKVKAAAPSASAGTNSDSKEVKFVKSKEELELEKLEKTTPPVPPKSVLELTKAGGKDSIAPTEEEKKETAKNTKVIKKVEKKEVILESFNSKEGKNERKEKGFISRIWDKIKAIF